METRQFLWGLSNGIGAFAIAGAFWLGLGIGMLAGELGGVLCAMLTLVQVGGAGVLIWRAIRLRRRSQFQRAELRQAQGRDRLENRHIAGILRWTIAAQAAAIAVAVFVCVRLHSEPMIFPLIGSIVSLHLIPLGRIFHVRAYYTTAGAGIAVSLATAPFWPAPYAVATLAAGMSLVMWASAGYLLRNADRIAERALRETWAV